jgi:Raf kinase inhibitor-like YbhB/YbcL family protein
MLLIVALMTLPAADHFTVNSRDLGGPINLKLVFNRFGCHGQNLSPSLTWQEEPKSTKSFAVTMHDPDAPKRGGWWHWIVVNIPANVHRLERGASPDAMPTGAMEMTNSYGFAAYGGPCPPKGDKAHRYIVTVYALDTPELDVSSDSDPSTVETLIHTHTLAKASLIGYYGR